MTYEDRLKAKAESYLTDGKLSAEDALCMAWALKSQGLHIDLINPTPLDKPGAERFCKKISHLARQLVSTKSSP